MKDKNSNQKKHSDQGKNLEAKDRNHGHGRPECCEQGDKEIIDQWVFRKTIRS
jgi:hypothetical protein